MKCSMVVVLLAVIITAVVPPEILSAGNPSGIYGTVLINGQGAGGLTVRVSEAGNHGNKYAVKTDAGGYYDIYGTPGQWEVSIEGPSVWTADSPTIVAVNLTEGSRIRVDFAFTGPALTPTPAPTALPTSTPTATPVPVSAEEKNVLEKLLDMWPKVELPVKETMFLGGLIIEPLGSLLGCLKIFGYFFAVVYCIVAVQWQVNHRKMSWQEFLDDFLLGSPGKMVFVVSIIAAPVVYLTALHDFNMALWITDNGYLREALGWKVAGFSPDLAPDSLLDLIVWMTELTALHISQEIFLLIGFVFAVIMSGLARNLAPLRIFGVFCLMYALYGVGFYVATIFVDSIRGAELVGNNPIWSALIRINKIFVASTKGLWYLMAYIIPGFYAVYEMFFAGKKPSNGQRRTISSEDALDLAQTGALLWNMWQNRQPAPAPAGGAWPIGANYSGQYPALKDVTPRQIAAGGDSKIPPEDAAPDAGSRDGKPPDVSGGGGGTQARPSSPRSLTGDTGGMPPGQSGGSNASAPKHSGLKDAVVDSAVKAGTAAAVTPGPWQVRAVAAAGSVTSDMIAGVGDKILAKAKDDRVPEQAGVHQPESADGVSESHQDEPIAKRRPVVGDDSHLPTESATTPMADQSTNEAPLAEEPSAEITIHKARMTGKFGDLEEGEPVLVKVGDDGTAETVDGMKIPLEHLTLEPDEEGGEG